MKRDLGTGVGKRRVRFGRNQQEGVWPEPAGADAGDVDEQLVSGKT
jgi:hypothetical protein